MWLSACYTTLAYDLQTVVVNVRFHIHVSIRKCSPHCVGIQQNVGDGLLACNKNLYGPIKSISVCQCIGEWRRNTKANCYKLLCPVVLANRLISNIKQQSITFISKGERLVIVYSICIKLGYIAFSVSKYTHKNSFKNRYAQPHKV